MKYSKQRIKENTMILNYEDFKNLNISNNSMGFKISASYFPAFQIIDERGQGMSLFVLAMPEQLKELGLVDYQIN